MRCPTKVFPDWDPLRSDPRFIESAEKSGPRQLTVRTFPLRRRRYGRGQTVFEQFDALL